MLQTLLPAAYPLASPLFAPLDWHLSAAAVLTESCPGRVYVDDPGNPRTAFIVSPEGHFLAGEASEAFASGMRTLVVDEPHHFGEMHIVCADDAWVPLLPVITGGLAPLVEERRYYEFTGATVALPAVPEGFALVPVDTALLARTGLHNHASVADWGMGNWGGAANFLARGVGTCLVHGDAIASWCLADCAVGPRCEIGIATDPDYRRRGLAALTTAATVAACLARGFNRIGWHCWTRNLGSRGVAERVGLVHAGTYSNYWCLADTARHAAERALHAARRGDRTTARAWRDHTCAAPDTPGRTHFHAAAVMAALGDYQAALLHLHTAVAHGGADYAVLRGAELFIPLHEAPDWPALLTQART